MPELFNSHYFTEAAPTAFFFSFCAYYVGRYMGKLDQIQREEEITLERRRRGIDWKFNK